MAVRSRTVTLNPAFLREIKEDSQELHRLLDRLRETVGGGAASPPPRPMFDLLEQLRDQSALHFALEEAYGYFDDPVDAAPRLAHQAELLRGQHSELYRELVGIVEAADELLHHERAAAGAATIAGRCRQFLAAFQRHEAAENELLLEAFADDLGVGD